MSEKIRVLVVDDSAFARQVVRRVLERASDIEVVDIARDGLEALEKVTLLRPDVVTLDLVMPGMDGIGVLESLPRDDGPRVVVVSSARTDSDLGIAALAAGAIDLVEKPTTQATDRLYEMADELLDRVRIAAQARPLPVRAPAPIEPRPPYEDEPVATAIEVVLFGTSTGGPQALARLLPSFPASFPVPIVVVVHMPPGYMTALARRLDGICALRVIEGHEGLVLTAGMAVLAPTGAHTRLERSSLGLRIALDYVRKPEHLHVPSVDALFSSAAEVVGRRALGVVMTGMGEDGSEGAQRMVASGAKVIAQSEASCVVYGMPRAIVTRGLADEVVDLDGITAAILSRL